MNYKDSLKRGMIAVIPSSQDVFLEAGFVQQAIKSDSYFAGRDIRPTPIDSKSIQGINLNMIKDEPIVVFVENPEDTLPPESWALLFTILRGIAEKSVSPSFVIVSSQDNDHLPASSDDDSRIFRQQ